MFYANQNLEFNGYLHSMKYICNVKGLEYFATNNDCEISRVKTLIDSNLHGSNYILPLLWSEDFDNDFKVLIEKNKNPHHRIQKYDEDSKQSIKQLKEARKNFCGIGIFAVKVFLNQKSYHDDLALLLRLLLETENVSINAKQTPKKYRQYKYFEKKNLILELIDLCQDLNINYGFKDSDIPSMKSIIFFDIEDRQISWHSDLDVDENMIYDSDWDENRCSNLGKIEEIILNNYQKEITILLDKKKLLV